jgi:glycosyltransferase involved in cell wall biosynthesis
MIVLFEGWRLLQHSYGTVLAFTLVHLWKLYGPDGILVKNGIIFYIKEKEYFRKEWEKTKKLVYNKEYNDILLKLREYNGEKVDLIYRHTYPYNVNLTNDIQKVPICVFYTSEFSWLNNEFFQIEYPTAISENVKDEYIKIFLKQYSNIHFVSPSKWSGGGMEAFLDNLKSPNKRNQVIPHGVDSNFFYKHKNSDIRNRIRKGFGVTDNDILMINIGAMTTNKGIILILQALNHIVNVLKKTNYKLMLKGTGDLYQCSDFLNNYLAHFPNLNNHIIFLDKTLSYQKLNDLFNACDLYVSPYLAEGFGLTMLEALTSGLKVLVPSTGSTVEYINFIESHGGKDFIYKVDSVVVVNDKGMNQNFISVDNLVDVLVSNEEFFKKNNQSQYEKMILYIKSEYSWFNVVEKLYNHFLDLVYLDT